MAKRRWQAAREKVEEEGRCRNCGLGGILEAAHIIPRSRIGIGRGGEDQLNVLPLCPGCHRQYDSNQLEVLPLLTLTEQSYIVLLVGIEEARLRTTIRGRQNADTA